MSASAQHQLQRPQGDQDFDFGFNLSSTPGLDPEGSAHPDPTSMPFPERHSGGKAGAALLRSRSVNVISGHDGAAGSP